MKTLTVLSFVFFIALTVRAQSCDCPSLATCSSCAGGISTFTLRYNGTTANNIVVTDQGGTVFSGVVNPNETFTFSGTTPNDKFQGSKIDVTVAGSPDATISANCGSVSVGDTYGSFTVAGATSKTGGTLCCSAANSDTTPPEIHDCPGTVVVEAASSCEAAATWTPPTATDNCSASLSSSFAPGSIFSLGTTVVTYTASDPQGNVTTCSFNVVVRDTKSPVPDNRPNDITLNVAACESAASWMPPTFSDNCPITIAASHDPGDIFPLGTTTVKYTATDHSSNSSDVTFNVTVVTTEAPVVSGCPANIVLHTYDDSIAVPWTAPTATPFCGDLSLSVSHQPGEQFSAGITEVAYEFTDGTSNKSVCQFQVNVIKDDIGFDVSKAVTPNGDGINDTWELANIDKFTDNKVFVVDRWGNKVYQAHGYDNVNAFWNATGINGSKVPVGTYFYTIEVRFNGSLVRKTGFIEVVY